jgi:hypothetical protein
MNPASRRETQISGGLPSPAVVTCRIPRIRPLPRDPYSGEDPQPCSLCAEPPESCPPLQDRRRATRPGGAAGGIREGRAGLGCLSGRPALRTRASAQAAGPGQGRGQARRGQAGHPVLPAARPEGPYDLPASPGGRPAFLPGIRGVTSRGLREPRPPARAGPAVHRGPPRAGGAAVPVPRNGRCQEDGAAPGRATGAGGTGPRVRRVRAGSSGAAKGGASRPRRRGPGAGDNGAGIGGDTAGPGGAAAGSPGELAGSSGHGRSPSPGGPSRYASPEASRSKPCARAVTRSAPHRGRCRVPGRRARPGPSGAAKARGRGTARVRGGGCREPLLRAPGPRHRLPLRVPV